MKNLLYIISLCGLLTACDLQEEPYGFYSDDNFYKSETDAESGLLYAYNAPVSYTHLTLPTTILV